MRTIGHFSRRTAATTAGKIPRTYPEHPAESIFRYLADDRQSGVDPLVRTRHCLARLNGMKQDDLAEWRRVINSRNQGELASHAILHVRDPFLELLEDLRVSWNVGVFKSSSRDVLSILESLINLQCHLDARWGVYMGQALVDVLENSDVLEVMKICSKVWSSPDFELITQFNQVVITPLSFHLLLVLDPTSIRGSLLNKLLAVLNQPFTNEPMGYVAHLTCFTDPIFLEMMEHCCVNNMIKPELRWQLLFTYADGKQASPLLRCLLRTINENEISQLPPEALSVLTDLVTNYDEVRLKPAIKNRLDTLIKCVERKLPIGNVLLRLRDPRLKSYIHPGMNVTFLSNALEMLSDLPGVIGTQDTAYPDWVELWAAPMLCDPKTCEIPPSLVGKLARYWVNHAKRKDIFNALLKYNRHVFHPDVAVALAEVGMLQDKEGAQWIERMDIEVQAFRNADTWSKIVYALCLCNCTNERAWETLARCRPTGPNVGDMDRSALTLAVLAKHMEKLPQDELTLVDIHPRSKKCVENLGLALRNTDFKVTSGHTSLPPTLAPAFLVDDMIYVDVYDAIAHPVTQRDLGKVLLREFIWKRHGLTVLVFDSRVIAEKVGNREWWYIAEELRKEMALIHGCVSVGGMQRNDARVGHIRATSKENNGSRPTSVAGAVGGEWVDHEENTGKNNHIASYTTDNQGRRSKGRNAAGTGTILTSNTTYNRQKYMPREQLIELFKSHHLFQGYECREALIVLSCTPFETQYRIASAGITAFEAQSKFTDMGTLLFQILKVEAENKIDVLLKKYEDYEDAITAINELKALPPELAIGFVSKFLLCAPKDGANSGCSEFFYDMLNNEVAQYAKELVEKLYPKAGDVCQEIDKQSVELQTDIYKTYFETYHKVKTKRLWLLEILNAKIRGIKEEAAADQDMSLLQSEKFSLSDAILDTVKEKPRQLRRRVIWQFLDTEAWTDDKESWLNKVLVDTEESDAYFSSEGIIESNNDSGQIMVDYRELDKVMSVVGKSAGIRNRLLSRLRRLSPPIQRKVVARFLHTYEGKKGSSRAWFIGIMKMEQQWESDLVREEKKKRRKLRENRQ